MENQILNKSIYDLELTVRSENGIKAAGIITVADLIKWSQEDLSKLPNLGRKSIKDIKEALKRHNLFLKDDEDGLAFELNKFKKQSEETKTNLEQFLLEDLVKEINNRGFSVTLTTKEMK